MDIGAVRLSREERQKRMREGRCFTCGEQGHLSTECAQRRNKTTGKTNFRSQDNKGGRGQGSKRGYIKSLFKSLSEEERKQLIQELRGDTSTRIRAMVQELPKEDREAAIEELVTEDFA